MLLSDMRRFILSARQNISGQLRRAVVSLLGVSLAGLIAISFSGCTSPAVFETDQRGQVYQLNCFETARETARSAIQPTFSIHDTG